MQLRSVALSSLLLLAACAPLLEPTPEKGSGPVQVGAGSWGLDPGEIFSESETVVTDLPTGELLVIQAGQAPRLLQLPKAAAALRIKEVAIDQEGNLVAVANQDSVYLVKAGQSQPFQRMKQVNGRGPRLRDGSQIRKPVSMLWLDHVGEGCLLVATENGLHVSGCAGVPLGSLGRLKLAEGRSGAFSKARYPARDLQRLGEAVYAASEREVIRISIDSMSSKGQVEATSLEILENCEAPQAQQGISGLVVTNHGFWVVPTSKEDLLWISKDLDSCKVVFTGGPLGSFSWMNDELLLEAGYEVLRLSQDGQKSGFAHARESDCTVCPPSLKGVPEPRCLGLFVDVKVVRDRVLATGQFGVQVRSVATGELIETRRWRSHNGGDVPAELFSAAGGGEVLVVSTTEGIVLESTSLIVRLEPSSGWRPWRRLVFSLSGEVELEPQVFYAEDIGTRAPWATALPLKSCRATLGDSAECKVRNGKAYVTFGQPFSTFQVDGTDELGGTISLDRPVRVMSLEALLLWAAISFIVIRIVGPWLVFLLPRTSRLFANRDLSSFFYWVHLGLYIFPGLATTVVVAKTRLRPRPFLRWLSEVRGETLAGTQESDGLGCFVRQLCTKVNDARESGQKVCVATLEGASFGRASLVPELSVAFNRRFLGLGTVLLETESSFERFEARVHRYLALEAGLRDRELRCHFLEHCRVTVFVPGGDPAQAKESAERFVARYKGAPGFLIVCLK